ncbi:PTP2 [Chrysodeixis chalcites nucleopolyhedrovirus]|uniref:PTP2 n=1 Tax=Chrysodeixis chalcites nucleopolyhedrovirus TaxID=320432 RepID=Q4KSU1_9ABAC|nr:PTP2 [Chrysodeixis chalcites nucleopolyhedrovirus]AAY84071.1 PTP2 [Chrysodeixis chalcites nucleopolyhedrovirus]AGE61399.1 PTP2 [Chrysodeixis chalcites nucleopolyhedrovirus]AGE61700.1 PTP2 [Chrysodeixis chalcites nucleopolyhedrovirus]AGE61849.1 PTP2 [Chrysodeixis chalcites nucleopolyhedrovirus]
MNYIRVGAGDGDGILINASKITDNLYLGGAIYDRNLFEKFLHQENITAVLTVWNDPPVFVGKTDIIDAIDNYLYINIDDNERADIQSHFLKSFNFLLQKIDLEKRRVYVHCHAGISRSATIVIHYLTKRTGYNLDEIYNYVTSRRSVINPNPAFKRQLMSQFLS